MCSSDLGVNIDETPQWVHGISGEVLEATELVFNYSIMENFTASSRFVVSEAFKDWTITEEERENVINASSWAGISQSEKLVDVMSDGYLSELELAEIDTAKLFSEGVDFDQRRSWHVKIWLPQLPSGRILLTYDLTVNEDIPTFDKIGRAHV